MLTPGEYTPIICPTCSEQVSLDPPYVRYVPLEKCISRMKVVALDGDTVLTARDLGVSFGD